MADIINNNLLSWKTNDLSNVGLLPTSKVGRRIDWSKLFDRIRLSYKKPLNWNLLLDENGNFSERNFIMGDFFHTREKNKLIIEANKLPQEIARYKQKVGNDRIFYYNSLISNLIKLFQNIFFLGNQNKEKGDITNVYVQNFFIKLNEINEMLKNSETLYNGSSSESIDSIDDEILKYSKEGIEWVEKMWGPYEKENIEKFKESALKFLKPGNVLDVDKVLETLNSHWSWNEDVLIFVFYTANCSKNELKRLQKGVLAALDSKFKKLDTPKIFLILEFILPYIFDGIENLNFDFPELFRPEYLSKIHTYDLTIEKFIGHIHYLGKENNWSQEIQAKLIEQFKIYGASEKGKIGFGQGSEQLYYWQEITGHLNKDNYKDYLKSEDLGENRRPLPNILRCSIEETKEITSSSVQQLMINS
ncbi:hypothetical protein M0P65_04165 [Candidatus Gracilibacteria bacterium]|nr:hypothetical protein [Candidatus Gracilibacteria bacterium]